MPATTDQGWATITPGPEANGLGDALGSGSHLDLAVGLGLRGGRRLGGVLSEVVGDRLALRAVDNQLAIHTGELILVLLTDIALVEVT